MDRYEVLIVGGGPAGLSAALYLARFDRRVIVFDNGKGRSTWHQVNHNYLGFPGGVAAQHLRELGEEQLSAYPQVAFCDHKIESMCRIEGGFVARNHSKVWFGESVILCTGVIDHYPHFEGWQDYVGRSMFWCITCDGFGCKGERIVVLGNTNAAASEAMQLTRFTKDVVLLTNSADMHMSAKFQQRLYEANIPVYCDKIARVKGENGYVQAIITEQGMTLECDQIFSHQGATPRTKLAQDLGVELSSDGYIQTDLDMQTNVPGVFAAGDVTKLYSHQISTAVYEGGQAACAANYYLYPIELKDD